MVGTALVQEHVKGMRKGKVNTRGEIKAGNIHSQTNSILLKQTPSPSQKVHIGYCTQISLVPLSVSNRRT